MKSIAVSDLRANLMKVLKNIEKGSSILITSRGKTVAKIIPPDESVKIAENKLAELSKTAKIYDILSPINENWKMNR